MQDLKVTLVQTNLVWENPKQNLKNLDDKLQNLHAPADLIILPEMFSTGFTMNVENCAEPMDGMAVKWLTKMAHLKQCVVTGSILIEEKGTYYNRLFWMRPDGTVDTYDKRHLFSMVNEHKIMTRGREQKIVELNGWKINLQICYDLRFPVWSKNKFKDGQPAYDVLLYVANWPEVRNHAYKSLLIARAIENQAFVLWVNRMGLDKNKIKHTGDTMAIDPIGKVIQKAEADKEEILQVNLSGELLTKYRTKFKVGLDWDDYSVKI